MLALLTSTLLAPALRDAVNKELVVRRGDCDHHNLLIINIFAIIALAESCVCQGGDLYSIWAEPPIQPLLKVFHYSHSPALVSRQVLSSLTMSHVLNKNIARCLNMEKERLAALQVYAFNVTNSASWLAGREALRVEEVGPFVYRFVQEMVIMMMI